MFEKYVYSARGLLAVHSVYKYPWLPIDYAGCKRGLKVVLRCGTCIARAEPCNKFSWFHF